MLQQALQRTVDPDGVLGRVVARRLEDEQADQPERDGPGDEADDADQSESLEYASDIWPVLEYVRNFLLSPRYAW